MSCIRLLLVLLWVVPAMAEDIRLPAKGVPALTLRTPAKWTSERDAMDNLTILSDTSEIVMFVSLVPTLGNPDRIAAKLLKQTPWGKTPAKLAGLDAFAYRGKAQAQDGTPLNQTLIVAPLDPQEAFVCLTTSWMAEGDKGLAPARAVIASTKLVRK